MNLPSIDFSKKEKTTIIVAVTLGNLLEWYEIYLYVHWAPIISRLFFSFDSDLVSLAYTLLMFGVGFLARPFGGVFFGRLGDMIGRKASLLLSLLIMTIPTFITGLLPTYAQIGCAAPLLLGLMRLLQAFPAGGELPGAFCYLFESAKPKERRFMGSWATFGYQMGILLSTVECYFLERHLSHEDLIEWGWRFSFLVGGIVGLCGLLMRYRLHETPLYREMVKHEKIVKTPLLQVLGKHKKGIGIGFLFCALNSSMFYLLSINLPSYFADMLGENSPNALVIDMAILILITAPLPWFGMIGDRINNKLLLVSSTLGILLLLYPLYLAIVSSSLISTAAIVLVMGMFFTMLSALIPHIMPALFPTNVRFTCVGFSFNLVDATIGGFTPAIALYLTHYTGNAAAFCWILLVGGILSLIGFLKMKREYVH